MGCGIGEASPFSLIGDKKWLKIRFIIHVMYIMTRLRPLYIIRQSYRNLWIVIILMAMIKKMISIMMMILIMIIK